MVLFLMEVSHPGYNPHHHSLSFRFTLSYQHFVYNLASFSSMIQSMSLFDFYPQSENFSNFIRLLFIEVRCFWFEVQILLRARGEYLPSIYHNYQ